MADDGDDVHDHAHDRAHGHDHVCGRDYANVCDHGGHVDDHDRDGRADVP